MRGEPFMFPEIWKSCFSSVLIAVLFASPVLAQQKEAPSVGNLFINAYNKHDQAKMKEIIESRKDEVPAEVQAIVQYAMSPDASPGEQDFLFNIAGNMSYMYKDVTGDERLLAAIKQNYQTLLNQRKATALPQDGVKEAKAALTALGKGKWRVTKFIMDAEKGLSIDIDVPPSEGGGGAPKISIKESQAAREAVLKALPKVKKGKITWSGMGIGLRAVLLD